jgi:hypothetical protein
MAAADRDARYLRRVLVYYINDEMKNLGESRGRPGFGRHPALSTLALVLGPFFLYIPNLWTIVTTMRRIQRTQEAVGAKRMNGWACAAVWILTLGVFGWIYTQSNLNRAWRALEQAPRFDDESELPPRFDTVTGRPILGYDAGTGEPILGQRKPSHSPAQLNR